MPDAKLERNPAPHQTAAPGSTGKTPQPRLSQAASSISDGSLNRTANIKLGGTDTRVRVCAEASVQV